MNKKIIEAFFDQKANTWDKNTMKNKMNIQSILNHAHIQKGSKVLDVACGTGVLFDEYIQRDVELTAIDLSKEMVKIAKRKYPQINVICGDVETEIFTHQFDVIMIYNAFPHFFEPKKLIEILTKHLTPHGIISIAHGMSREKLIEHHNKNASNVSIELLHIDELEKLLNPYFDIETKISNECMYQIVGIKK